MIEHPITEAFDVFYKDRATWPGSVNLDFSRDLYSRPLGTGSAYENNEWMAWVVKIWEARSDTEFYSNRAYLPKFCRNYAGTGSGLNSTNAGLGFNTTITMKDMPTNLTGIDLSGLDKNVLAATDAAAKMRDEGWAIVSGKWDCSEYPKCGVGDWTTGSQWGHPTRDMDCWWYCTSEYEDPSVEFEDKEEKCKQPLSDFD